MFKTQYFGIAFALLPLAGCDPSKITDTDTSTNAFRTCNPDGSCQNSNCDDINQPDQGPGSDFSMPNPDPTGPRYKLTGFYPDSTGVWRARGFRINQNPSPLKYTSADGTIQGMRVRGTDVLLDSMRVTQTDIALSYCPITGCDGTNSQTVSGTSLPGTQLVIKIASDRLYREAIYTLTFDSAPQTLDLVKPSSPEVVGYSFSYSLNGSVATSLCMGPQQKAQRTMFYQSAYWHPETFIKTGDSTGTSLTSGAITVTCELGAIAACMSWGYKPWEQTETKTGKDTKDLWHAICVNAKTANYCGDGHAWTKYGTSILVQDQLVPAVMNEMPDLQGNYKVEALWTEKGASCVNDANRRIQSLPWSAVSCNNMPACPAGAPLVSQSFATGIP